MSLINYEINLILTWSSNYVTANSTSSATFTITDKKPDILVVTMSTQDNKKLLRQLKSGFKPRINQNEF